MTTDDSYLDGNTKFCSTCGSKIHEKAEICPNCGVRVADMENNSFVNINNSNINLASVFTILGTISGVILALILIFIVFHLFNLSKTSELIDYTTQILPMYFLITLTFFSSLSGILGKWLSSKNSKLAILEYIIASIGISISTIMSFIFASAIPFLSLTTGISPIFVAFLGILTVIFFVLVIFLEHKNVGAVQNE